MEDLLLQTPCITEYCSVYRENACIFPRRCTFPYTHTLYEPYFILNLKETGLVCSIRNKPRRFFSNFIKGGNLYVNAEIAHSERGFDAHKAEGQRDGSYKQLYKTAVSKGAYSLIHYWEKGASQLRRITCLFVYKRLKRMNLESIIASETKRISSEYGKSFLDCEDIVKLTGLGRDNVRTLMRSKAFPVIKVGKRQVVSIVAFVAWQMNVYSNGDKDYGKQ